jgi:hypothetical protein
MDLPSSEELPDELAVGDVPPVEDEDVGLGVDLLQATILKAKISKRMNIKTRLFFIHPP